MPHDVFISYSSSDKTVADAVCAALERKQISCWIAPRDVLAGTEFGDALIKAIGACQVFVLIFSSQANESPYVRREVERAVSKGKLIVPFRIEDILPSNAMEFALSNTHWLDALTPPLEAHLAELWDVICRLLSSDGKPKKHEGATKTARSAKHIEHYAILEITSDPAGASVAIDGAKWEAKTPASIKRVPWGRHHYKALLEGETETPSAHFDVQDFFCNIVIEFPQVKRRRAEEKENELWAKATESDSEIAYVSYLKESPLLEHKELAGNRIQALHIASAKTEEQSVRREEQLWADAVKDDTEESYKTYLAESKLRLHVEEAEQKSVSSVVEKLQRKGGSTGSTALRRSSYGGAEEAKSGRVYYETVEEVEAFFTSLIQYRMVKPLGEGAFGMAILAFDETEQVQKVFKLPRDRSTTEALKNEGANLVKLRNLSHKNIIQLYQYGRTNIRWNGEDHERYYLCLAYGGTSLRDKHLGPLTSALDENGNPSWDGSGIILDLGVALAISIDVCQGLEAAHGFTGGNVRILHRDIKPDNILIDDDSGIARITDFGISRVIDRSVGMMSVSGSSPYMDPECIQGHAGPYSDLYSLGIVMYEMLTGHLPFENMSARFKREAKDPRELNEHVPQALSAIILKALARNVEQRYQNASDMLRDLRRLQATLNPLPPHLKQVEQFGSRLFICDDTETKQRVAVRLFESQVPTHFIVKETDLLRAAGIAGATVPCGCFRNEHMLGVATPRVQGQPISVALEPLPVAESGRLERLCHLFAEVSSLLARLHTAGIVHGCLCPEVIYVDEHEKIHLDGLGLVPVLKSRKEIDQITFQENFGESLQYMSPSYLGGSSRPKPSDDIFSVGALLFYFLTGSSYYGANGTECVLRTGTFTQSVIQPREINSFVTPRLLSIMWKALGICESAGSVYGDASQLAADLGACRWPDDLTDALCEDATKNYEAGDVLEAYNILERALFEDPGNARIHLTKGLIYFHEKEFKWAVPEFENTVTVEPSLRGYLYLVRSLLELENRVAEASRAITAALTFGDGPEVRELHAKVLYAQGRKDDAVMEIKRAIVQELEPLKKKQYEYVLSGWNGGEADRISESSTSVSV